MDGWTFTVQFCIGLEDGIVDGMLGEGGCLFKMF